MPDFDENPEYSVYKTLSKGDKHCTLYRNKDGMVYSDNGCFIGNLNNDDWEDSLEVFIDGWYEVTWDSSDYADYFGCDEEDVNECLDDFIFGDD